MNSTVAVDGADVGLLFQDTLGCEKISNSLIPQVTRGTDLCFLCFRADDSTSFDALSYYRRFVEQNCSHGCRFCYLGLSSAQSAAVARQDVGEAKGCPIVAPHADCSDLRPILAEEVRHRYPAV